MKNLFLFLGLLLVAGVIFFAYNRNDSPYEAAVTQVENVKEEQVILLYPESGEVSFKAKSTDEFIVATASPTIIPNNAIVHTGIGKASVLLPDNSSFSLDDNTEIIVTYNDNKTSMYQNFGTTYHRVEKLITGGSYQVQTAGTLAAVRGTKFAVSYDKKKKKTKVAVTESKVEVSASVKATSTGTLPEQKEMLTIVAGKTVSVDVEALVKNKEGKLVVMQELEIAADTEMRTFVDTQKKMDYALDGIKKDATEKKMDEKELRKELRKEMKRVLFNDDGNETEKKNEVVNPEVKNNDDTPIETKKIVPKEETLVPKPVAEVKPKIEVVVKPEVEDETPVVQIDEEKFFTVFEPLFIKHFYIDDTDAICSIKLSPLERVRVVQSFAKSKGYPFTKDTLVSFASAIDEYCMNKDRTLKAKLQARFDDEYPF